MRKTSLTISFLLLSIIVVFAQSTEETTIYFASNKYELTNLSKEKINKFIKELDKEAISKISLIGHTDRDGSLVYNQNLSKKRTETVANYLFEKGFQKSIIELDFHGETNPVTINEDEKGKQINRRVVIIVEYSEPINEEEIKVVNLEKFAPQFKTLEVNPTAKTDLSLDDKGTVLHIPQNCFVDKNGQPVTDKVTIKYKEYQNSADIAFSNIPMTYTKDGEEFFFNSSGMFEIQGTANGEPVSIAPNQQLTIDYALAKQNPDLQFYKLSEDGKDWEVVQNINTKEKGAVINNEEKKENIDNKPNDVIIDTLKKEIINFVDSSSSWSLQAICLPNDTPTVIYLGNEEIASGKIINEKFEGQIKENWNTKKNKGFINVLVNGSLNKEAFQGMNLGGQFGTNQTTLLAENIDAGHTYPDVVKGLNVNTFGVYNCDQIYQLPNRVKLLANYINEEGQVIDDGHVLSMIDLNYNGAYSFSPEQFLCSKTGQVTLVLFTKSKEIYMIDNQAFSKMDIKSSGKYTFQMKNMTDEIKTSKDLAKHLNL